MNKFGVLLINLGSPDSPGPEDVGRYLRQFLMDPYVIDLPGPLRWLLVNVLIVPRRKYRSSEAYQKIWGKDGSPLVRTNFELRDRLRTQLGNNVQIELGMRYGSPSIEEALHELRQNNSDLKEIIVVPLYPQYAASSSETAIQECMRIASDLGLQRKVKVVPPFYSSAGFIEPVAEKINSSLQEWPAEHLLFSYHGLPMKAVGKECTRSEACFHSFMSCPSIDHRNVNCYRAQCYATTEAILPRINFDSGKCSIGFQSRLTKKWIQPFSDAKVAELAGLGVKKLAVVCPSFTADCLETLEEVAIQFQDEFVRHGGEELRLIPAVNESTSWVKGLAKIITDNRNEI